MRSLLGEPLRLLASGLGRESLGKGVCRGRGYSLTGDPTLTLCSGNFLLATSALSDYNP